MMNSAAAGGSPLSLLISTKMGRMADRVEAMTRDYQAFWPETPDHMPDFYAVFTMRQKRVLEGEVDDLLERVEAIRRDHAGDREELQAQLQLAGGEMQRLCTAAGLYFDHAFTDGFGRATREFLGRVKAFDRQLTPENCYQALRNVWIFNSLQALQDRPLECPAPAFAYSMLYPYSDNVNDDTGLALADKIALNLLFRRWLEGEDPPPASATGEKIRALVRMIETTFSRRDFPGVFQSLLGIFNAQVRSLIQQKQHQSSASADILAISVEKGGTSVLADGYLIDGVLDPSLEEFCFGYGVFLQFADDLQDVGDDRAAGHQTLFSVAAESGPLDRLANRLFHYMTRVVERHLCTPGQERLRLLILKNCYFMAAEAIIKTGGFYSPDYLREIERHFPLTFPHYRRIKKRLKEMLLQGQNGVGGRQAMNYGTVAGLMSGASRAGFMV